MTFSIDQFRLDRKVAVVTGAGGRGNSIGRAYALGLGKAGASVVVADLQAEGARRVCDEIVAEGGKAIAVTVDITKPESVKSMAEAARATFGGVDILVNNAALMAKGVLAGRRHSAGLIEPYYGTMISPAAPSYVEHRPIVPLMRQCGGGKNHQPGFRPCSPSAVQYMASRKLRLGSRSRPPPSHANSDEKNTTLMP